MSALPIPASETTGTSVSAVLVAQAALLARAGHLAQAEQWLAALLPADGDAGLRCLLGKVQAQQGRVDDARASLRAALQSDPAHAGARAALDSLDGGQPALRRRMLMAGGATLAVLAVAAGWLMRRDGGAAAPQSATVRVAPVGSSVAAATTVVSDPVAAVPLQGVDDYARLVLELRRFEPVASLQPQPVGADAQGLKVRLGGAVASAHVLGLVRAVVAGHPQLRVDDAALTVDHRYRVRQGDSLSAIAASVYGRADRWPRLWRANRQAAVTPRRLAAGTVLVVP